MFRPIQSPDAPVTVVGAGEATPELLKTALKHAPFLVAADGGARLADAAGALPRAVLGDFDSVGALELPGVERVHLPDQDATDFMKCLMALDAPLFIGVGFLGGRLDHQMAAFTALLQEARPVVLLSARELAFVAPLELTLNLPVGSPFSVYPLLPARLTTRGLKYPLTEAEVAPDGLISTSNEVAAEAVEVISDRRAMLVTAPLGVLEAVLSALGR
ncbi:MAG: thiamine diphosphokinase [Pseudomonadota bacterium]